MTNAELKQIAINLVGEHELSRRFRIWISNLVRKEEQKRANQSADEHFEEEAGIILADLNKRAKRRHTLTNSAKAMIRSRLSEGFVREDFFRVHEIKCAMWLGHEVMDQCLRPSTLYRPNNFSEYLAEWDAKQTQREELNAKRKALSAPPSLDPSSPEEKARREAAVQVRKALLDKVKSRAWNSFDTFEEFYRWTAKLPDADSIAEYPMPDRLRKMRIAPMLSVYIYSGKKEKYQWAEDEYAQIKGV